MLEARHQPRPRVAPCIAPVAHHVHASPAHARCWRPTRSYRPSASSLYLSLARSFCRPRSSDLLAALDTMSERIPRTTPKRGPNRLLAIVVHAAAVATFANAFRVLFGPGPMADFLSGSFGGQWCAAEPRATSSSARQFLTIISLFGSLVMMGVALLADFVPGVKGALLSTRPELTLQRWTRSRTRWGCSWSPSKGWFRSSTGRS